MTSPSVSDASPRRSQERPAPSAAPVHPPPHPLLSFVDFAFQRCASVVLQRAVAVRAFSSAASPSLLCALCSPALTWAWFREEWLRCGCRMLPLLALSMQSQRVLLHSSAWCPPAAAPAALSAPLYRAGAFPAGSSRALLLDDYDALTGALLLDSRPLPLAQRALLYFALYTLYCTQLTVERYPIPAAAALWPALQSDAERLAALPVQDAACALRALLDARAFVFVAAFPSRALHGNSDFQRRRRAAVLPQRRPRSEAVPTTRGRARAGNGGARAHSKRRLWSGEAAAGGWPQRGRRGDDDDDGADGAEESGSESDDADADRRPALRGGERGAESGAHLDGRLLATAQRRFDALTAQWVGDAQPQPPPPSAAPSASPPSPLPLSFLRLSAWLSSGRPLPLRAPQDVSWQRELEALAVDRPLPGATVAAEPASSPSAPPPSLSALLDSVDARAAAYAQSLGALGSSLCPASTRGSLSAHLPASIASLQREDGDAPRAERCEAHDASRAVLPARPIPASALSVPSFLASLLGPSLAARIAALAGPSPRQSQQPSLWGSDAKWPAPTSDTLQLLAQVDRAYQQAQAQHKDHGTGTVSSHSLPTTMSCRVRDQTAANKRAAIL